MTSTYQREAVPVDGLPTDTEPLRMAWRFLLRIVGDGPECAVCGASEGQDHEPTDQCGIVSNLLDEARALKALGGVEVCLCAALRFADGDVIRGHRHNDALRVAWDKQKRPSTHGHPEQGFLTTRGRFVDRKEGQRLQLAAGIPSAASADGGYRGNNLYSEDLY